MTRIAIVGSGLSGGILANELARRFQVTVFEKGGNEWQMPERTIWHGHPRGLETSFINGIGGTTNLWHGAIMPLSRGELTKYWPKTVTLGLAQFQPAAVTLMYGSAGLEAFNADRANVTDSEEFLDVLTRFDKPFRSRELLLRSLAAIRLNSEVVSFEEKEEYVEVIVSAANALSTERFDLLIVAAGAFGSPGLLQRSGVKSIAGQHLTDHPMGFLAKAGRGGETELGRTLISRPPNRKSERLFKVYDAEAGLWSGFYLRPAAPGPLKSDPYRDSFKIFSQKRVFDRAQVAMRKIFDRDFLLQVLQHVFGITIPTSTFYVLVVSQQEALSQGSVASRDDGGVDVNWLISQKTQQAIARNLSRFERRTGFSLCIAKEQFVKRLWSAAHHSGTCRISESDIDGVVDENLRIHGAKRCYVCDGSVLPSTGASNTGLTIAALSLRLVDHLTSWQYGVLPGTAPERASILMSGPTSNMAAMTKPALTQRGEQLIEINLRREAVAKNICDGKTCLLHFANDHFSRTENWRLQEKAALAMEVMGIKRVIIPQTFATLTPGGNQHTNILLENLGISTKVDNVYIGGKRDVEKFWLSWQEKGPERSVVFIYIPTVVGPRSNWTKMVVERARGCTTIVPRVRRFHTVKESELAALIAELATKDASLGISRTVALSESGCMADAVSRALGRAVKEMPLTGVIWGGIFAALKIPCMASIIYKMTVVLDSLSRGILRHALVSLDFKYFAIYNLQEKLWLRSEHPAG